jgi:hypothetical protein
MKKLFLMAASAAMMLASCSEVETGNKTPGNGNNGDGSEAQTSIAFTVPIGNAGASTRADDGTPVDPMKPGEFEVNAVDVWVFGADGLAAETGHHDTFNAGTPIAITPVVQNGVTYSQAANDFYVTIVDGTPGTNAGTATYVLKDSEAITTTSGDAIIYVGINVPETLKVNMDSTADLKKLSEMVGGVMAASSKFVMFGETPYDLQPADVTGGIAGSMNRVKVSVDRVASKLVGTTVAETLPAITWNETDPSKEDIVLTYKNTGFNVYNEMVRSYYVKQLPTLATDMSAVSGTYENMANFEQSYAKSADYSTTPGVNGNKTLKVTTQAFTVNDPLFATTDVLANSTYYIGENMAQAHTGQSLNGNTTYAMVSTQVTVSATAVWVADNYDTATSTWKNGANDAWDNVETSAGVWIFDASKPLLGHIEWTGGASNGTTDDLYIVNAAIGETYIVKDTANENLSLICYALSNSTMVDEDDIDEDLNDTEIVNAPLGYYTYLDSYVHFQIYLNPNKGGVKNDYNINRNQLVHLHVTQMKDYENFFPGYPGDPDDPKKPIDPTNEEDPNNPDPKDDEDPIDPEDANLVVEITINPWSYWFNEGILGR